MNMYRLMIVDDERRIVRGLTSAVQSSGLPLSDVRGFHSANEALEAMRAQPCDILLSDIRMPERDGLELIGIVKSVYPSCRVVFLTGYGQFEYAQQAVKLGAFDFLVKPVTDEILFQCLERAILSLDEERETKQSIDNLKSQYEETVPVLRSGFIKQLLAGDLPRLQREETLERSRSLNVPLDLAQEAVLLLVRLNNRHKARVTYSDAEIDGFLFAELAETLSPDFRFSEHWDEHGFLVCVLQSAESPSLRGERLRSQLRQAANTIREKLLERRGIEISVLLSGRTADYTKWPDRYKDAVQTLKQHISPGPGAVLDVEYDAELTDRNMSGFEGLAAIGSLDLLLESGNEQEYYERLSAVFAEAKQLPGMPYRVFAEICQIISLSLIKALNRLSLTEKDQASLAMDEWANVNRFSSVDEMSERFIEASRKVFVMLKRQREDNKDAVSRLKWHISQNLAEDLSLTQLAKAGHMSSAYLSRIFKEQTGEGINHYITRLRIERATELLRDPALKIADVAVRTGYDNIPYFTKVFKKVVGITPQEFKKL
ncbi:response regulator [Paenibacillus sp. GCM10027626]|uniref:response regulator n=1 Tax=Paenibacillus sp. GCM10027626 TaxID=3273411 RepID=UPI00363585BF